MHTSPHNSDFSSFRHTPRRGTAGSHKSSAFTFGGNLHTDFCEWLPRFTSPPTMDEGCFSLHILTSACYVLSLLIVASLAGVRSYLVVVLICGSLMISDGERLFMYLEKT